MVSLYFTYFEERFQEEILEEYLAIMPKEVTQKLQRMKVWKSAQSSLLGKILLIKALQDYRLPYNLNDLKYTLYGKPYFQGSFNFNISHSGSFVVLAVSNKVRIGVDVEEIKPIDIKGFEKQWTSHEWGLLTSSANNYSQFYDFWTIKEAAIKADGRGLSIPLKDVIISGQKVYLEDKIFYLKKVHLQKGYAVHIATAGEPITQFRMINL